MRPGQHPLAVEHPEPARQDGLTGPRHRGRDEAEGDQCPQVALKDGCYLKRDVVCFVCLACPDEVAEELVKDELPGLGDLLFCRLHWHAVKQYLAGQVEPGSRVVSLFL